MRKNYIQRKNDSHENNLKNCSQNTIQISESSVSTHLSQTENCNNSATRCKHSDSLNKCVVTIPIYKAKPSKGEEASFRQGLTVLRNYDIVVYTYPELDLSAYESIAAETGKAYRTEYFDHSSFTSVRSYNRLCLDRAFYERFAQYEYLLIYQLDAWVFRDELQEWSDKGYDYIGAPLFEPEGAYFNDKFIGIGNGGFSLRRIQYCLDKLDKSKQYLRLLPPKSLYSLYKIEWHNLRYKKDCWDLAAFCVLAPIKLLLRCLGIANNMHYFRKDARLNEDMIFGVFTQHAFWGRPHLPSYQEAMHFSFEVHPAMLYEETEHQLPFGCHAFEKYEYENFWSKHISIENKTDFIIQFNQLSISKKNPLGGG